MYYVSLETIGDPFKAIRFLDLAFDLLQNMLLGDNKKTR